MACRFNKERKESGKHDRDEEKKVIQRACQRLRDMRYKFVINQNLPKSYQTVVSQIQAHSDDEYIPDKDVYVVKKLPYCSEAANIFFKRLDEEIQQFQKSKGKRPQNRRRVRAKNPPETIFPQAPKGLPIDFYNPDWFNNKLPAQKMSLADNKLVAFLPNPVLSLSGNWNSDEWLSNKHFTDIHWERATKPYDLSYEIKPEEDDDESEDLNDSDYGKSIDLEATDDEEEDEEEEEEEDDENEYNNNKVLGGDEEMSDGKEGEERYPSKFDMPSEWDDWQWLTVTRPYVVCFPHFLLIPEL